MLDKIWRFLKQLIQRLFGTNPKIEPTPPQPAPTLTDAEYEAKLMELLEGVNQGWGRGDVAGFLLAKRIKDGDLAAWLRGFGVRSLEGAQGSTASADAVVSLQELARRLELLGEVVGGELGEVAGNVGREILVEFPLVSDEGGEDVDGEAEKWKKRGNEQCALGDFEGAIASYDKALEIKPDYYEVWDGRGIILCDNLEEYGKAIASFDKVLEIKPNDHPALHNLGVGLYKLGRLEEAIISYDKALEFKPDFHEALHSRGAALVKLRRFEEAITSFDKALEIKPDKHESWYSRGNALDNLGRFEEAITSFDKALEIKPDKHEAWNNRGSILYDLGRLEEAISSYEKALEIKPNHHAWYNRGASLVNLGRFKEAIPSFDKALEFKPDFHNAWISRGRVVKNAPGYNQLVYEMLQLQFPKSPAVIRTLITHKLTQRGYEEQILTLQAGLQYCRRDTHAEGYGLLHQALGTAHYDEGKFNSSSASYKEALKTLTPNAFLKLHLEVLQKLIKTLVSLKQTDEANKLRRDATDLLQRLLKQNDSKLTQQQLADKLVSFEQLTVNIFIQSGQFAEALATAETDKNVCLSWLLDALPIPDYQTEETEETEETEKKVTHAQIQQLLNPATAGIYWHLSDAALTTFIIKSDGFLSPETSFSDSPDEFEEWVKEWNQQYTDYQSKEKTSQVNHPWRGGMASKFARLNAILKIDVIEQQLEGITDLILIPHRDLHRFPIHALFSRDFVVSYLPSAAVGLSLQQRFSGISRLSPSLDPPKSPLRSGTLNEQIPPHKARL